MYNYHTMNRECGLGNYRYSIFNNCPISAGIGPFRTFWLKFLYNDHKINGRAQLNGRRKTLCRELSGFLSLFSRKMEMHAELDSCWHLNLKLIVLFYWSEKAKNSSGKKLLHLHIFIEQSEQKNFLLNQLSPMSIVSHKSTSSLRANSSVGISPTMSRA